MRLLPSADPKNHKRMQELLDELNVQLNPECHYNVWSQVEPMIAVSDPVTFNAMRYMLADETRGKIADLMRRGAAKPPGNWLQVEMAGQKMMKFQAGTPDAIL